MLGYHVYSSVSEPKKSQEEYEMKYDDFSLIPLGQFR